MKLPCTPAWFAALIVCALAGTGGPARGHGESHKADSSPVVKEQKAWGIAGDAAPGIRTLRIAMTDQMRFIPAAITVKQGETVRFVVRNDGKLMHEFVLGTKDSLDEHAALMVRFPTMEHDEPYMAHVPPGKSAEIVWNFNRAGDFAFACLIAGHYQAGMVGKVRVSPNNGRNP